MTADDTPRLVAQLRRRERWLMALAAVRAELLSGGTVAEAMAVIAERCALLSDADAALILLADGRGPVRIWAATGPLADVAAGPETAPVADTSDAWARAVRDSEGVRRTAELPAPDDPELARVWSAADSLLAAPIPVRDGVDGVVICLRAVGRPPFEPESEPEVTGLAEQASLALEVVGRAKQRRLAELMADRERIARDLHDHVIQRLFAVGLSLQGQVPAIEAPAVRERVDRAVAEIDEAMADLRASIFDLRSAEGDKGSLRRRLADITARASDPNSGPRVTLRCRGPIDTVVAPQLAVQVEAVVREAVSNAVRHSGAATVLVTVTASDELQISVVDDGRGMPPEAARSGLKNLAERAISCGGTLAVDSVMHADDATSDGATGTTLRWTVPL
jgi:signal transduction histidine kinase